jgi:hypothetical protein
MMEHYDARRHWPSGFEPSVHYNESRGDGVIREGSAGYVIQTCDYTADKTDAARHVPGLKKGVIVLPSKVEEMQSWYSDFTKSRSRQMRHRDDFLVDLRNRGLLVSSGELTGR